jgi:hypothetical protein
MALRQFSFDPGLFDTKIQLGKTQFAQRVLNTSMRSLLLEDLRDRAVELWPQHRRRLAYLVARNKALAASILQVTGTTVFFDASKTPAIIRHLCRDPEIDLRVVHLVRDVRGTSLSRRKNRGETNWRRTVSLWVRANCNIERQLRRLPADRSIRIRYEDLCRAPQVTLDRFFEFCGLEPHAMPLNFSTLEHHVVGNRMRLSKVGQISLDEDWRRTLTSDEQAHAWNLAGPLHVRYGYPPMTIADLTN